MASMRLLLWVLVALVVAYVAACAALYLAQRALIYHPQADRGTAAHLVLRLAVDGAEVAVTTAPRAGPRALLYFGGNAEDVAASLPQLSRDFPGRALYLVHYRGYGASTGAPTEAALHADAAAVFDRVHAAHPEVLVMGRSLGSGVAVRLASRKPVEALVLVTPYDSLREIAARQFPAFPVRWLIKDSFDSVDHAPAVSAPTLLLAAEQDDLIPAESTARLAAAFRPGIARLVVITGAGHNTLSLSPAYGQALRAFPSGPRSDQTSPTQPSAAPAASSQSR
jgi:pimeloyl-ACP methyl ester carboxylesterase